MEQQYFTTATTEYKRKVAITGVYIIDLKHVVVDKLQIMFRISDIMLQNGIENGVNLAKKNNLGIKGVLQN